MNAANLSLVSPAARQRLSIKLLGKAEIKFEAIELSASSSRMLPLLALLVLNEGPVTRDLVARLLWRRVPATSAMASLRQLLHHLPAAVKGAITASRNELSLDKSAVGECDVWKIVDAFPHAPSAATLLLLYPGTLLADRVFDDLPEFDDWLNSQRENLAARVRHVTLSAVSALRRQCQAGGATPGSDEALALAQAWLQRDPFDDAMHGEVMQLQILVGNLRAAEAQFDLLRRTLATSKGRKPTPATQAILDQALRRRGSIRGTGLPALATSFVGRQDELAEIARMLSDAHCRLITLHGPGGIGKTRLALAFADETRRHDDDAYFVGLEAAQSTQGFYAAVAAAFGFELSPRVNPREVLCEALRTSKGLLVLDNFEQLLPTLPTEVSEARDFLPALLREAPGLKMLVTSRVSLGLQEEWLLELGGLSYPSTAPESGESADVSTDTAVELFTSRARQAYRGFSRTAELPHVLAICRAADGLPLALELAAAQVGSRPCAEIARDLLNDKTPTARASNRPERHVSVRRVIEQSLAAASDEQTRAFATLALFQGAFSAALAFAVARVRESTLQELAARALLQSVGDQYKLHPLLRELASTRLAKSRAVAARLEASYVAEMARRAMTENARLLGAESVDAMASTAGRFNDEMNALKLACKIRDTENVVMLAAALVNTAHARGLVRACVDGWPEADDGLPSLAACALWVRRADLLRQLGDYDQALADYARAEAALGETKLDSRAALRKYGLQFSVHAGRAGAYLFRGDYTAILAEYATAQALVDADVPFVERVRMDSFAGTALMELGELERARILLEDSLSIAGAADVSAMVMVMLLNALGGVAHYQGKLDRCIEIHRHALKLLQDDGLQSMQSRHLCNLGGALLQTGEVEEAESAFEKAIAIATIFGDRGPLTFSQIGLANAALIRQDLPRAGTTANQARMNARRMGSVSLQAEATAIMIRVAIEQYDFVAAAALLIELAAETGGKVQGFRKLEIVFCGLRIAHETAADLNGIALSAAAALLRAHPACTDILGKDIQAWERSLKATQPTQVPEITKRAPKAVSSTDEQVDELLASVIAGVRQAHETGRLITSAGGASIGDF